MGDSEGGTSAATAERARVLVVDDSDVVRKVVARVLAAKGHTVTTAASGEEAFAKLIAERFDLLVTDVVMGALSGIQLCRLVRSDPDTAHMPVVLLTAAYDPRSRFWGAHSGADACIAKEAMNADLAPTVARLLAERRPPPARTDGGGLDGEPLARLSQVLDQLLFQAVIAAETRRILPASGSRGEFADALIQLASQVTDYAYLTVRLDGPDGPTHHVHARAPWPAEHAERALATLGIEGVSPTLVTVRTSGSIPPPAGPFELRAGDRTTFAITTATETVGSLTAFGGHRRLSLADQTTLAQLAQELGVVVRALFLMEQTHRMANTDALTALHNRHRTTEYLVHEVERARRYGSPLSVLLVDVDHFKRVNDLHGHAVGDEVLRLVADVLRRGARTTDVVGRWGGEEFLVVLPNTDLAGAAVAAERLRILMEKEPTPGDVGTVTVSGGLASFVGRDTPDGIVSRADVALYQAKEAGRNRIVTAETPSTPPAG